MSAKVNAPPADAGGSGYGQKPGWPALGWTGQLQNHRPVSVSLGSYGTTIRMSFLDHQDFDFD